MKKLSGAIAMLLISSGANAAQLVSYDGTFISGTGSIAANQLFSGEFTFDINSSPSFVEYDSPTHTPPYSRVELKYENTPRSVVINGGQPIFYNNGYFNVVVDDNFQIDQNTINEAGLNGVVQADTYDYVEFEYDSPYTTFDQNDELYNGAEFSLFAIFDKNTFTFDSLQSQGYQSIYALTPIFQGFFIQKATNGVLDFRGTGRIDHFNVTEVSQVPVPGAAWLFGSALAGLALRLRKQA
ncbi:MAG: hypothetical protein Q8Q40_03610 [Methylococcaceae bacterium]|nr:hypothetical protein [Methylococcaceae bacterium]MDP3903044.1 hypothetical protein [Methylococcaceae bacterium]